MKNKRVGLGDVAHWAFRPVVYVIDWIWGTDLKDCDRCKERRARWNTKFSVPTWVFVLVVTISATAFAWGCAR